MPYPADSRIDGIIHCDFAANGCIDRKHSAPYCNYNASLQKKYGNVGETADGQTPNPCSEDLRTSPEQRPVPFFLIFCRCFLPVRLALRYPCPALSASLLSTAEEKGNICPISARWAQKWWLSLNRNHDQNSPVIQVRPAWRPCLPASFNRPAT